MTNSESRSRVQADFNTQRRSWCDVAKRRLKGESFRLAYAIVYDHLDRRTHQCITSLQSISAIEGMPMITVRRGVKDLEAAGLVVVHRANGKRTSITLMFQNPAQYERGDPAQNERGSQNPAHDPAHDPAHAESKSADFCRTTSPTPYDSVDSVYPTELHRPPAEHPRRAEPRSETDAHRRAMSILVNYSGQRSRAVRIAGKAANDGVPWTVIYEHVQDLKFDLCHDDGVHELARRLYPEQRAAA